MHRQHNALDALVKCGLPSDRIVVLNAEEFEKVGRDDNCTDHARFHKTIWQRTAKSTRVKNNRFEVMRDETKHIAKDAEEQWIVFECKWGGEAPKRRDG